MPVVIISVVLIIIIAVVVFVIKDSKKIKKGAEEAEALIEENCPNARIIVNQGGKIVFFVDDVNQTFGYSTNGVMYSLSGIRSVFTYPYGIAINHDDVKGSIEIGKVYNSKNPLLPTHVKAIENEALKHLRTRLTTVLKQYGITPTHEYIHNGTIWGCDINSKMFYTTYSTPEVKSFSDLLGVTIEDTSNNTYIESNYIIHVRTREETIPEGFEYDIYFKSKDDTFNNLLSMFKGIRNRQK